MNFSHQFFLILLLNVLLIFKSINSETNDEGITKSSLDSSTQSVSSSESGPKAVTPSDSYPKTAENATKARKTNDSALESGPNSKEHLSSRASTEKTTTKALSSVTESVSSASVLPVGGSTTKSPVSSTTEEPSPANQAAAPPIPIRRRFDHKKSVHFDPITKVPMDHFQPQIYDPKNKYDKGPINKGFDKTIPQSARINLEKEKIGLTLPATKTSSAGDLFDMIKRKSGNDLSPQQLSKLQSAFLRTTIDPEECENTTSTTTSIPIPIDNFEEDFDHSSHLSPKVKHITERNVALNREKTDEFIVTDSRPSAPSDSQPLTSSESQTLPPSEPQPLPPSESQPLPPSESQTLPPSVSQPPPPSESQPPPPSESQSLPPSESQTLPPSEPQPLPPSESQPLPPSESQTIPPSEPQPLPPAETQPSTPSETQPLPTSEPILHVEDVQKDIQTEAIPIETTVQPINDLHVNESIKDLNDSSVDDLIGDKLYDIRNAENNEDENTTVIPKTIHESVDSEDSCEPHNIQGLLKTLKVLSKNEEYLKVVERFSHEVENMTFLNEIVIGKNEENSHEIHPTAIVTIDDDKDVKIAAKNSGKSDHRLVDTESDDSHEVIVIEEDKNDHDEPIVVQQETHYIASEPNRRPVNVIQPTTYRVNPSYGSVNYYQNPQLLKQRQTTILTPAYRSTSYQVVNPQPIVQYRPYYQPVVQYQQSRGYPKPFNARPVSNPNIRQWTPIQRQNAFNNNANGINKAVQATLRNPPRVSGVPHQQNIVPNRRPVTQFKPNTIKYAQRPRYPLQTAHIRGSVIGKQNVFPYNSPNARPIQNVNSRVVTNPRPIVNAHPPVQRQIQRSIPYIRPLPKPIVNAAPPPTAAPVRNLSQAVTTNPTPPPQRQVIIPNPRAIVNPNPRPVLTAQSPYQGQVYQRQTLNQPQSQQQSQHTSHIHNRFSAVYNRNAISRTHVHNRQVQSVSSH